MFCTETKHWRLHLSQKKSVSEKGGSKIKPRLRQSHPEEDDKASDFYIISTNPNYTTKAGGIELRKCSSNDYHSKYTLCYTKYSSRVCRLHSYIEIPLQFYVQRPERNLTQRYPVCKINRRSSGTRASHTLGKFASANKHSTEQKSKR